MDGAGSEGAMSDLSVGNLLDDRFDSTDEDYDMDIKAIMNLDLLSVILPEDHSSIGDEPVTRGSRRSGRTRCDRASSLRHNMANAMTNEDARLRLQIKQVYEANANCDGSLCRTSARKGLGENGRCGFQRTSNSCI